jgi:hypothetical protein
LVVFNDDDEFFRRLGESQAIDFECTSAAYSGATGLPEASVDLVRMTTEERALEGRPGLGLGKIRYLDIMEPNIFTVVYDPVEGNDAHCLIKGPATKPNRKILASRTKVLRMPEPRGAQQGSREVPSEEPSRA